MALSSAPVACLFLLLLCLSSGTATAGVRSDDRGFISAVLTEKGLDFAKDLLVDHAVHTLVPLHLPDMKKSFKIPLMGGIRVKMANITLVHIEVSSSTIQPGDSGVVIEVMVTAANLTMDWSYAWSTWLGPFEISDGGRAAIQVEGMEVGFTVSMENQEGSLTMAVTDCGCYMKDISITLEGGASWFYQGLVNAFEDQIRAAVVTAIKKKTTEGISKIDSLLQKLPKEIRVDDIVSINVTFVGEPVSRNSSIEFDIDGLFTDTKKVVVSNLLLRNFEPPNLCDEPIPMLGISLDEAVLNSASVVYFEAGRMHWVVDKVPDPSLLNTAGWRFIVPQLYKKYPNEDMVLNISLSSPPVIKISRKNIDASITADMIVDVLDGSEVVPVACISMVDVHREFPNNGDGSLGI